MKGPSFLRKAGIVLAAAGVFFAPFYLPPYPLYVVSLSLINILAVCGVNLMMGYTGLISLGLGGIAAAATGYVLGFTASRLGALCVAMVTYGFGMTVVLIAQNWLSLTNGPNGLVLDPPVFSPWSCFRSTSIFSSRLRR